MSSKKLLAVMGVSLLAASAQASVITTVEGENLWNTQQVGMTEVNFNDGTTSPYVSVTGDYTIYNTPSGTGQSAPPYGINSKFISVPNPIANGSASFTLDGSYDYFGMFWGSVDTYNSIHFYDGASLVASLTGSDISPLIANGNQSSWNSNRFVNFFFDNGDTFDSFVLTSTNYAFETDNHAYGNQVSVSEPATLALLGLGLAGLGFVRRKQA
jgi:hypothetical protein